MISNQLDQQICLNKEGFINTLREFVQSPEHPRRKKQLDLFFHWKEIQQKERYVSLNKRIKNIAVLEDDNHNIRKIIVVIAGWNEFKEGSENKDRNRLFMWKNGEWTKNIMKGDTDDPKGNIVDYRQCELIDPAIKEQAKNAEIAARSVAEAEAKKNGYNVLFNDDAPIMEYRQTHIQLTYENEEKEKLRLVKKKELEHLKELFSIQSN